MHISFPKYGIHVAFLSLGYHIKIRIKNKHPLPQSRINNYQVSHCIIYSNGHFSFVKLSSLNIVPKNYC